MQAKLRGRVVMLAYHCLCMMLAAPQCPDRILPLINITAGATSSPLTSLVHSVVAPEMRSWHIRPLGCWKELHVPIIIILRDKYTEHKTRGLDVLWEHTWIEGVMLKRST
ncbi:hypothetical protein EDC04DRAFT_1865459 [Pisolithus marmoratus]|nr:hypothetical protein EDC04DRAFT_1865459 [Pisolithus marmoratus]